MGKISIIEIDESVNGRISQGDIFKDIKVIASIEEDGSRIEIKRIVFPYVLVLSQDCDLEQHSKSKTGGTLSDKSLLSTIVVPMYNYSHLITGKHLELLQQEMQEIRATDMKNNIQNNKNERYHSLAFPSPSTIPESVIDFKHFFTVSTKYLEETIETNRLCRISPLFRELISQRFANYLSRIGLPPPSECENAE